MKHGKVKHACMKRLFVYLIATFLAVLNNIAN